MTEKELKLIENEKFFSQRIKDLKELARCSLKDLENGDEEALRISFEDLAGFADSLAATFEEEVKLLSE